MIEERVLRVGLVGGQFSGLLAAVIALERVTDRLDTAIRVGRGLDGGNSP